MENGSEIKDTEDLEIDSNYMYILEYEAPGITDYTYNKTTINIEDEEYDITAILTEEKNGTKVYSITTDQDAKDKASDEISWTKLVKDAVIVLNYDRVKEETEEAAAAESGAEDIQGSASENNAEEQKDSVEIAPTTTPVTPQAPDSQQERQHKRHDEIPLEVLAANEIIHQIAAVHIAELICEPVF